MAWLVVIGLYVAVNAAYIYALPIGAIATASSTTYPDAPAVATKAVATFLSGGAGKAVALIFIVSALGTLNGNMLTTPRVAFAMARDGQFFSVFGALGARSHVPVFAIATNTVVAGIARRERHLRPTHRSRGLRLRDRSTRSRRGAYSSFAARGRTHCDRIGRRAIPGCRSRS